MRHLILDVSVTLPPCLQVEYPPRQHAPQTPVAVVHSEQCHSECLQVSRLECQSVTDQCFAVSTVQVQKRQLSPLVSLA